MKPELFVAYRYIFAKKSLRTINIITWVSMAGIATGTAAINIVLSVLNGFKILVMSMFLVIDTPLQIFPGNLEKITFNMAKALRQKSGNLFKVEPFIEKKVLIASNKNAQIAFLKAIPENRIKEINRNLVIKKKEAPFEFKDGIILGRDLQFSLGVVENQEVAVVSSKMLNKILYALEFPFLLDLNLSPKYSKVTNFFYAHPLYDQSYALTTLKVGQGVLGNGKHSLTGLGIRYKEGNEIQVQKIISEWAEEQGIKNHIQIKTIKEKRKTLFQIMDLEKLVTFIALSLVIAIAAIGLIGSLTMTVLEKQKEIFAMRSFGFSDKALGLLFKIQAFIIGIVGSLFGTILALTFCYLQKVFGLVKMPYGDSFLVSSYPIELKFYDFAITAAFVFLVVFLISIYPSQLAKRVATIQKR